VRSIFPECNQYLPPDSGSSGQLAGNLKNVKNIISLKKQFLNLLRQNLFIFLSDYRLFSLSLLYLPYQMLMIKGINRCVCTERVKSILRARDVI